MREHAGVIGGSLIGGGFASCVAAVSLVASHQAHLSDAAVSGLLVLGVICFVIAARVLAPPARRKPAENEAQKIARDILRADGYWPGWRQRLRHPLTPVGKLPANVPRETRERAAAAVHAASANSPAPPTEQMPLRRTAANSPLTRVLVEANINQKLKEHYLRGKQMRVRIRSGSPLMAVASFSWLMVDQARVVGWIEELHTRLEANLSQYLDRFETAEDGALLVYPSEGKGSPPKQALMRLFEHNLVTLRAVLRERNAL